jgi:hypothetical protein
MRNALRSGLIACTLVIGIGALVAPVVGQGQAGYKAPRAADGHPDLNGIWQALNTANYDIEPHVAKHAMALRPGPYGPLPAKEVLYLGAVGAVPAGMGIVEGGQIPYKPEALKIRNENREKWLERDPEIKCYLPGVPRAMYMPYPFQIIQSPKHIMIIHEFAGAVRTIYMDNHTDAPADSWMGWSNGKWEGETLVIDTKGYLDTTWFDRAGNHHSDALHTIERISARSADTLNYEVTIEDPNVFTRTWKMSFPLYRHVQPNAQLTEYRCVEFSEEMLYGHLKKKTSE